MCVWNNGKTVAVFIVDILEIRFFFTRPFVPKNVIFIISKKNQICALHSVWGF